MALETSLRCELDYLSSVAHGRASPKGLFPLASTPGIGLGGESVGIGDQIPGSFQRGPDFVGTADPGSSRRTQLERNSIEKVGELFGMALVAHARNLPRPHANFSAELCNIPTRAEKLVTREFA